MKFSEGIKSVKLRYRLEKISKQKFLEILHKDSVIYMDGAHNPHGAAAIAQFLQQEYEKDKISNYVINGRTKYTDSKGFLAQFLNIVKFVAAVRVQLEAIPESPYIITESAQEIGIDSCVCENLLDAVEKIHNYENSENKTTKPVRIVICGSFYLAKDLALIK